MRFWKQDRLRSEFRKHLRPAFLAAGWALLLCCWAYRELLGWPLPILLYILYLPGMIFLPIGVWLTLLHLGGRSSRELGLAVVAMGLTVGPVAGWRWNLDRAEESQPTLRVATANLHSYQNDVTAATKSLANLDLDVIFFQEIWTQTQLADAQQGLPGYRFFQGGGYISPNYFEFGTFIASRLPVQEGEAPSIDRAVAARVQWTGRQLFLVSLHGPKNSDKDPANSSHRPTELLKTSKLQTNQAQDVAKALLANPGPAIIGGDFNAPDSGPAAHLLRGTVTDSFREAGQGWGNTFPADFPIFRLDRIYSTEDLVARGYETLALGSDHLAVVAEFQWANR